MIRSEKMGYYNLVLFKEAAREVINQLGNLECLQFEDMNPDIPMNSLLYFI